jgi:hypothetical protein
VFVVSSRQEKAIERENCLASPLACEHKLVKDHRQHNKRQGNTIDKTRQHNTAQDNTAQVIRQDKEAEK